MSATETKTGIVVSVVGGRVRFENVQPTTDQPFSLNAKRFFEVDAVLRGVAVTLTVPYWHSQPGDVGYSATVWQVESIASGAPDGRYYLHLKRPELVVCDRAYGDTTPEAVMEWRHAIIECEIA